MTVNELLSGGGVIGAVVVLLALVEISPIKINPWSAIGKAIGRAINGDVIEKLEATRKTLDDHIRTDDARNADMHRAAILRFNNELDFYEQYCESHPDYKNNRAVHAVANIKRVYDDRLIKHDFL